MCIRDRTNTVCTGATVCVGYAWCLYVDFRVYRSIGRLRRRHLLLGAQLLALLVLLVANLFGTGWIFSISADNAYHRGPLNILLYLLLFGYYAGSVWQVHKAKHLSLIHISHCPSCWLRYSRTGG